MGFFNNVKNSLTETSQDLTQKAKDTSEVFRLNNANKAKEKEIEKVIYQIGVSYYSNAMEECSVRFPELTMQVKHLQEEIAANKRLIEELSTEEICPSCGKKINRGSKFCIYCGASINVMDDTTVEVTGKRCASCGSSIEKDAAFCTNCGTPVPQEMENETVVPELNDDEYSDLVENTEENYGTGEYEEELITEPVLAEPEITARVCTECGRVLEDGEMFCMNCGKKVE